MWDRGDVSIWGWGGIRLGVSGLFPSVGAVTSDTMIHCVE